MKDEKNSGLQCGNAPLKKTAHKMVMVMVTCPAIWRAEELVQHQQSASGSSKSWDVDVDVDVLLSVCAPSALRACAINGEKSQKGAESDEDAAVEKWRRLPLLLATVPLFHIRITETSPPPTGRRQVGSGSPRLDGIDRFSHRFSMTCYRHGCTRKNLWVSSSYMIKK